MNYAPKILDNLLDPEIKKRILEALKTKGKAAEEDISNTVQLVYAAFGGERAAAVELVSEGLQYYLLFTKVTDNTKPFEINEKPKKKREKLTPEEIYTNFLLTFPETKNYLELMLKLKANNFVSESLKKGNIEDITALLLSEVSSKLGISHEGAGQFVEASSKGFNLDAKREVVTAEDINHCFEADLLKIKLLSDFTELKLREIIYTRYEARAKLAEEALTSLLEGTS